MWPSGTAQWRATFFFVPQCFQMMVRVPQWGPCESKVCSVLRVCLLLLSLAINAVNALWHPHTPVLSTDEREIWAVKIVRSSCQRCKTWIFCIKISSIVWVETYEGSFVVLIYSINNKCIFMTFCQRWLSQWNVVVYTKPLPELVLTRRDVMLAIAGLLTSFAHFCCCY